MSRPPHNPKAPYRRRTRRQPGIAEVSRLDQFLKRLRTLGADDEMIEGVAAAWHDETWENRDLIASLDDEALRAEIESIYSEHVFHTAPAPDTRGLSVADVPDGTVAEVLEWVGGDPARASLALDAETASGKPRVGIVTIVESILGS